MSFGVCKALMNFVTGAVADRFGRRGAHVVGWGLGVALGLLLLVCSRTGGWAAMLGANTFLGAMQALTWSTNIFMLVDLLGPSRRALANGLSNGVGYVASAASGFGATARVKFAGADAPLPSCSLAASWRSSSRVMAVRETRALAQAEGGGRWR